MPLTDTPPKRRSKATLLDVTYEDVRQSFLTRLHGDEVRLAVLRAALETAAACPAPAFVDLEKFAHRMRGAAAVFNFPELRDVAKALELAAACAAAEHSCIDEPRVQKAMRELATTLARLNGFAPPANAELASVPAN